jgi:hypothetical protein
VTIAAAETRHASEGEGFADAVTVSWADDERGWYGMARLGLAGPEQGSALAVVFRDREPLAALALGGLEVPADADWPDLDIAGLRMTTEAPLERWTVSWAGTEHRVELSLEAISPPAELAGADPVATLGGMAGYEQLVRVRGQVRSGGETTEIDGVGQRGHSWGTVDWSRLELTRTVSAWLGEQHGGVVVAAMRPDGARAHADEAVWAVLLQQGEALPVDDPRVSTTYDSEGHQRRVGLELWVGEEDDYPYRAAGEVICGSSLELGALRLDLAFMRWHAEGEVGVGRYDILRRA